MGIYVVARAIVPFGMPHVPFAMVPRSSFMVLVGLLAKNALRETPANRTVM